MSGVAKATPIVLTGEVRAELERLARSTKTEYRLRQRADRAVGGRGEGDASDGAGDWLHQRHGEQAAGRLRRQTPRRAGGDRRSWRRAERHNPDRQAHPWRA